MSASLLAAVIFLASGIGIAVVGSNSMVFLPPKDPRAKKAVTSFAAGLILIAAGLVVLKVF